MNFATHPESIELLGRFNSFESSKFGLIDLSQLDLNTITDLYSQFKNSYSNEITSRDQLGEIVTGNAFKETIMVLISMILYLVRWK